MIYLHSKGIIHCDLATRNVLVRNPMQIEVSDFGLSRLVDEKDIEHENYTLHLPWAALELLNPDSTSLHFTVETDVWAFGVTMWEIFTFGSEPFAELELNGEDKHNARELLYTHLLDVGMLDKPEICEMELYLMMIKCMHYYFNNWT